MLQLSVEHIPFLRSLDLVIDRPTIAMRGKDGTIIEAFEWREGVVERAHAMPQIYNLRECYGKVCNYTPLRAIPEAASLFAMFAPLDR